jgi:hypothetical protein
MKTNGLNGVMKSWRLAWQWRSVSANVCGIGVYQYGNWRRIINVSSSY